jgi:hypothetical protein
MSTLFCRHNRFTADCPICPKGTVLEDRPAERRRPSSSSRGGGQKRAAAAPPVRRYPQASAGPARLEKVPGGLRLGLWSGGQLEKRAPELAPAELVELLAAAEEQGIAEGLLSALQAERGSPGPYGKSSGRTGDMQEELRVEQYGDGNLRVARWVLRPATRSWELQDAPVMLPAKRYVEALRDAARAGVMSGASAPERH